MAFRLAYKKKSIKLWHPHPSLVKYVSGAHRSMITKTHICSTLSRLEQHPKHILKTKRCVDRETQCVALSLYQDSQQQRTTGERGRDAVRRQHKARGGSRVTKGERKTQVCREESCGHRGTTHCNHHWSYSVPCWLSTPQFRLLKPS